MKHGNEAGDSKDNIGGYGSFKEAARDIEKLVDVVWVSGTRKSSFSTATKEIRTYQTHVSQTASLQVPYLLSLALLVVSYIPSFPAAPRTMFRVLSKLDYAFASLIQGRDVDSGDLLPGCERGSGVSGTGKVRIKSIIERTRVVVVEAMSTGEYEQEEGEVDAESGNETDDDMGDYDVDDAADFDMEIARVYDRTLVELGDTLGGPAIGIPPQSDEERILLDDEKQR